MVSFINRQNLSNKNMYKKKTEIVTFNQLCLNGVRYHRRKCDVYGKVLCSSEECAAFYRQKI